MIVSAAEGGIGRWFRIHSGWVSDRMAGAKVDGVSYDDASLTALAAIVTADLTITDIELVRGIHRVLPTGGPDIVPFSISGRNNLKFHCEGAVYNTQRIAWDHTKGKRIDVDVNLFKFLNCSQITITGPLTVNGMLTQEQVRTAPGGSPIGTIGIQFEGTCHDIEVDIVGFGLMMPLLLFRPNKATLDVSRAPLIWAGGAGYEVNDVVTVASIGNTADSITPATLAVTSVDAGVVTGLAVINPGVFPHFNNDNMPAATAGYPVTGGTGVGLRIGPFTVDYDEKKQTMPMGQRGKIKVQARQCGRAMSNQCALSDCQIDIDADVVYRAHMIYGVTKNRVNLTVRNKTQNAVFSSVMGMPSDIKYSRLTVLPTTIAGFCPSGTVLVIGLLGACVARLRIEIVWDANRVGGNDCGQYLKVEKYRQAVDDDMPRGHEVEIIQGGRISGRGLRDSGLHTNIIGTNVNYSDASWLGDQIAWVFRDGFTVTNVEPTWGLALNAYALRSLTIGKVNLSCVIKLDPLDRGISLASARRVLVDTDAIFANRYVSVGAVRSVGEQ